MEHLIRNLIEQLINKRKLELSSVEKYKKDELNDLILISSGKIIELDSVIQKLRELLDYYNTTK
jgi:L-serine deaminase